MHSPYLQDAIERMKRETLPTLDWRLHVAVADEELRPLWRLTKPHAQTLNSEDVALVEDTLTHWTERDHYVRAAVRCCILSEAEMAIGAVELRRALG